MSLFGLMPDTPGFLLSNYCASILLDNGVKLSTRGGWYIDKVSRKQVGRAVAFVT